MNVNEMEELVKNYKSKETEASSSQLDFGLKIANDAVGGTHGTVITATGVVV